MDLITRLALIADPLLTVHNYSAADQIVEWWEFYFQLYVFLQLEHYCSTRSALLVSTCQPSAAGWLAKFRAVNCEMKNFRFASECWEILRAVGKIRAPGRKAMIFHVRLFRAVVVLCCFVCVCARAGFFRNGTKLIGAICWNVWAKRVFLMDPVLIISAVWENWLIGRRKWIWLACFSFIISVFFSSLLFIGVPNDFTKLNPQKQ